MKVGIVGAGPAGLACARKLGDCGIAVALFDKGRQPGARLSSRELDGYSWDYGARYLRPQGAAFREACREWQQSGLIAAWPAGPQGALVGVPTMARLIAAQCEGLPVRLGALIQRIDREREGWFLSGPELREGPFDAVVAAVPAEQAAPLLSLHDLDLAREAALVRSLACWTALAAFAGPVAGLPAYIEDRGDLAWAVRGGTKPGRPAGESWVIQAGPAWSQANRERDADAVAPDLLALLAREAGVSLPEPVVLRAHRWRFALPIGRRGGHLWNADLRIGACGDWCSGSGIEDAWLAGTAMAGDVARSLQGAGAARSAA